jgi:membrane protease YdiL (CAAX protease family)
MRFLKSEAGAITLWLVASLFAAALLTPYLYDWGKAFAASAELNDYPSFLESIASSAGRANLDRFFSRALLISALALLPALIRRVKKLPRKDGAERHALRKLTWKQRLTHLACGLLTGALVLGVLGVILELTGVVIPRETGFSAGKLFSKALISALGAGVVEELIFRGLVLGLWLRACSVGTAWIGSSLMFSFVHFLSPPIGMQIADPRSWHAGLEMLGATLGHFANPLFFITNFTTLALLGLLLGWCRIRTSSLWLPIGLHAGLVFTLKTFSISRSLDLESPFYPWLIGNDLKSGVLPLVFLGICFGICVGIVRMLPMSRSETNHGESE